MISNTRGGRPGGDPGTAPYIVFNSAGGAQLTEEFGGDIIASARISVAGMPNQTVFATTNGCIAVDEP